MKKVLITFVSVMLVVSSRASAQSSWKARKGAWDALLENKPQISLMAGGDLNGDYVDDIAAIYKSGPDQGLVVLISDREEYKTYRIPENYLDLVYHSEIARAQRLWIRDGSIELLCPFDGTRLLPDVTENADAALRLKFFENSLKLTDINFNAALEDEESRAHVWFDVNIGRVYVNYLAAAEEVGGKRSYYFRYYYRFNAYPVGNVAIDANDDEWALFSYPVYLHNSPVGNPITYGFERWTSDFDLSAQVYVGYDAQHLYCFMNIYDDVFLQTQSGDKILRGDHIELWFAGDDDNKVQIGISPGDFAGIAPEARLWYSGSRAVSERPLNEVAIAAERTETGYALEWAIPLSLLPKGFETRGPQAFSLTLSDSDQENRQEKVLTSSSLRWGESYSLGELVFK